MEISRQRQQRQHYKSGKYSCCARNIAAQKAARWHQAFLLKVALLKVGIRKQPHIVAANLFFDFDLD